MRPRLAHETSLRNIGAFLRDESSAHHGRCLPGAHPFVVAMAACAAAAAGCDFPLPAAQIRTRAELTEVTGCVVSRLPLRPAMAEAIHDVMNEIARNALQHSRSRIGAFLCVRHEQTANRIAIGVADAGIGIEASIARHHAASTPEEAIRLSLRPALTGTAPEVRDFMLNGGGGLFIAKSLASLSRNRFVVYSGTVAFHLRKVPPAETPRIHRYPEHDRHRMQTGLPTWQGTVVGMNLGIVPEREIACLRGRIRRAYLRSLCE